MIMLAEINVPEPVVDIPEVEPESYVPSVQDKILRVIYRLEHGETLAQNAMYDGQNFCVLGLFADESDIGFWHVTDSIKGYKVPHDFIAFTELPKKVKRYYGFVGKCGDFMVKDLPDTTKARVLAAFDDITVNDEMSIMEINDDPILDPDVIREMLVEIIRSGVLFKEPLTPEQRKEYVGKYLS